MQLGGLESAVEALGDLMCDVDFDVVSGVDASRLVSLLTPLRNQLDGFMLAACTRALAANQHNVDGARSGAAWVAERTGVSEKQARVCLALGRQLALLPEVAKAVSFGSLSLAKASAIGRGADGDESVAGLLLDVASGGGTVEMIEERAREIRGSRSDESRREDLRKSQFVNVRVDGDSMVTGSFKLLPELAVGIVEAHRRAEGSSSWERAESFVRLLDELGSKKTQVVFHLDIETDESGDLGSGDRASLKGVGSVPESSVTEMFEEASFKLVGTYRNKMVWFSEKNRRSSTSPLPEFVKRAVRARARDRCEAPGCTGMAEQVDHIQARCNEGLNDPENLQALCEQDHHAKTRVDAPWTNGGIYGKENHEKRKQTRRTRRKSRAPSAAA